MVAKWKKETVWIIIEKGSEVQKTNSIVESLLVSFQVLLDSVMVICITLVCAIVSQLWRTHYLEMSKGFHFTATEA